jgi:hypothetical protein
MKLDARAYALASGLVMAALYSLCRARYAVAPDATAAAFSYLLQIDVSGLKHQMSWDGFVAGLAAWSTAWALAAAALAGLYNRLSGAEPADAVRRERVPSA